MPLDILQKIANIFANADINNCIQEEFHVESNKQQMEFSDTESGDFYNNGRGQNKIIVDDCITWTNVHMHIMGIWIWSADYSTV